MRSPAPLLLLASCSAATNYLHPTEPRYAADYASECAPLGPTLKVVSLNLRFGRNLEQVVRELGTPPLAGAELVLLQEMDASGVDRIARELGHRYVYYPATIRFTPRPGETSAMPC